MRARCAFARSVGLVALLAGVAPIAAQSTGVTVAVVNPAPVRRDNMVLASVPFARGELLPPRDGGPLLAVEVADAAASAAPSTTSGLPLLHWPDGSIALLQVAVAPVVAAHASAAVVVTPKRSADGAAVAMSPWPHAPLLSRPLPLWTEVVDPWGRVFRADLVPDAVAGPDGIEVDTGAVRVQRFRAAHRGVDGDARGRPWLDLEAWLTTFDGERRAELVVVLDNREPSAGPLGPVRLRGFRVCTSDDALRFLPAFARELGMPAPTARPGGGHEQWLLPPSDANYLGDGTAKAFRLHLFGDDPQLGADARSIAAWAPVREVAFAALDAVRHSRAFACCGGPAPRAGEDPGDATAQLLLWRQQAALGPWSDLGDPADGALGGAPRQGDALLHNVLRWQSPELLAVAEGMVLQHSLRPTGGRAPRLPADTAALRAGLLPASLAAPHGFTPIDYEHCSATLLFDWWWLTGDAFAREELRRIGASVRAMLPAVEFMTSRGEGNALLAGTLAARATGDRALLAFLVAHAVDAIAPAMAADGAAVAIAQPPHPLILDGRTAFDAPAQMAALVRGLAALHRATDDARLLPLVRRIADAIAGPAWVEGEGPKTFVSGEDPGRYTFASVSEDRSGADRTVIGALVLAAELVRDPESAARWRGRADFLLDRELPVEAALPERVRAAANPWLQIALDRRNAP